MKHDKDDTTPPHDLPRLRDCVQTATFLNVCPETVRRLNRDKKLRAVQGLRKLLFTTEAIEEFLRGRGR